MTESGEIHYDKEQIRLKEKRFQLLILSPLKRTWGIKMKAFIKKDIGIVFCIIFYSIFIVVTNVSRSYFDGAYWYVSLSAI